MRFLMVYYLFMFISPGSIAFKIGQVQIHWYGILIGLGILLCYLFVVTQLKRRKIDRKPVDDMAFWVILAGVLGARIYYVLFNFSYFLSRPVEILQVWKGGLAIHGALIGGAAAFFIYVFKHKLSWTLYADAIMPGILLAQAVGRWGNFFNSEAFGRPADLPWKLYIPFQNRPAGFETFEYFHPTFLYESLWNLLGFVFLVLLSHYLYPAGAGRSKRRGLIFCAYLIWYSLGRFFIESLRLDSLYIAGVRAASALSVLMFLAGILGLIFLVKKHKLKPTN